jgi:predicted nucleic acid-binding protein
LNKLVIDASVAVKWVVPEANSEAATRLLTDGAILAAPSHWLAEIGTTLWAMASVRKIMTRDQAEQRIQWVGELVVQETPVRTLLSTASAIAFDLGLTVYDTLYLALAEKVQIPLVTADRKLFKQAKASARFDGRVLWLADLPDGDGAPP